MPASIQLLELWPFVWKWMVQPFSAWRKTRSISPGPASLEFSTLRGNTRRDRAFLKSAHMHGDAAVRRRIRADEQEFHAALPLLNRRS